MTRNLMNARIGYRDPVVLVWDRKAAKKFV